MQRRSKLIVVIFLFSLPIFSLSQDLSDSYLKLPLVFDFKIREIPAILILDSVLGNTSGSQAFFKVGFQHPDSEKWIWFTGTHVPFSNKGFFSNFFEIELVPEHDTKEAMFLDTLFTRNSQSRRFKLKCDCPNELPKILL